MKKQTRKIKVIPTRKRNTKSNITVIELPDELFDKIAKNEVASMSISSESKSDFNYQGHIILGGNNVAETELFDTPEKACKELINKIKHTDTYNVMVVLGYNKFMNSFSNPGEVNIPPAKWVEYHIMKNFVRKVATIK